MLCSCVNTGYVHLEINYLVRKSWNEEKLVCANPLSEKQ